MKKWFVITLVFILIVPGSCGGRGTPVQITLNFKPGDTFRGFIRINQTITQVLANQPLVTDQNIESTILFRIREIGESVLKIDTSYETLTIEIRNVMNEVRFDSRAAENPPELAIIREFLGKTFTLVVSSGGDIPAIEGLNEITDDIIREHELEPMAVTTIMNFFSEKQLKNNFVYLFNYLPGEEVRVGNKWQNTQVVTIDTTTLNTENTWKFRKAKENTLILDLEATISGADLKGRQAGRIVVDKTSGWIQSGRIMQDVSGDLQFTDTGQKSGELEMVSNNEFEISRMED